MNAALFFASSAFGCAAVLAPFYFQYWLIETALIITLGVLR